MSEKSFQPGDKTFLAEDAPAGQYSAVFEDDGETGYFYAVDLARSDKTILDAVHVYNVASVVDRERPSALSIVWSDDGPKWALLINSHPHAAFDFAAKRAIAAPTFPIFPVNPMDSGQKLITASRTKPLPGSGLNRHHDLISPGSFSTNS